MGTDFFAEFLMALLSLSLCVLALGLAHAKDGPVFDSEAIKGVDLPPAVMNYWAPFLSKNLTVMELMHQSAAVLQDDFRQLNSSASKCYSEQLLAAVGVMDVKSMDPSCVPVKGATGLCQDASLNQKLQQMNGAKPSCTTDWEAVGQILECRLQDKAAKKWAGLMSRISQIICWDSTKSHPAEFSSFLETSEAGPSNSDLIKELRDMRRESSEATKNMSEKIAKMEDELQKRKSATDHGLNLIQAADTTCAAGEVHCPKAAFGYAGAVKSCDCKISGGFCSPFALTTHWAFFAELWIWNFWKVNCEDFITPGDSSSASSFLEVERKPVRHSKKHAGLSKAHHMVEKQDVSLMLEREEEEEKKAYWFDWFKNPKVKDNMPDDLRSMGFLDLLSDGLLAQVEVEYGTGLPLHER